MKQDTARSYYEQGDLWDHLDAEDRERIEKMVQMVPEDVETVADLGCGSGFFVQRLRETRKVVGLDWSREALKKLNGNGVVGEIQHTPFRDGSFDMVVCSEVLEHLPVDDFTCAINELRRLVKRWLFITVPYEEELESYFSKCADCGCIYHAHRHVRSFNIGKLLSYFPGFEMKTWETFGQVEWIGRLEAKIWHGIGNHWVVTETGRCPQCGSGNKVAPDRGVRDLLGLALARGVRLFHAAKKPRWLMALMKRKSLVS